VVPNIAAANDSERLKALKDHKIMFITQYITELIGVIDHQNMHDFM